MARRRRNAPGTRFPLYALLRRRRLRGMAGAAIVLLAVVALVADRTGVLKFELRPSGSAYDGRAFVVTRVVDGDTIIVTALDGEGDAIRVRLWGIDTPEKFLPDRERPGAYLPPEPFAEEASARTRALCEGEVVHLITQAHRVYDRYDRLLAYVVLPDGTVVNEVLLAEGLARAEERWEHAHLRRYVALEREAQRQGAGMWGR